MTTRIGGLLSGVLEVTLKPLDEADAVRLLSRIAWNAEEPSAADRTGAVALVKALGGLPLEIELAGDSLRTESLSPAEYLADLEKRIGAAAKDRERVVAVLTRSLAFLGEDARLTLQALAVLPRAGARIDMVAITLGVREPEAARRLDRLVRHHLATFAPETGRYRIHPRVREAARDEAERDSTRWAQLHEGAGEAMDALGSWVREPFGTSSDRARERWDSVSDIFDSLDVTGWETGLPGGDALASCLVDADHFRAGDWQLSARNQTLDRAERLSRGDAGARRARVLQARAQLRGRQGDLAGAAEDYDAALALFVAVRDRLGQARTIKERGDLRHFQDDMAGAAKDYDAALALFVADDNRLGQGHVLRARGSLRVREDDMAGAAKDYDAALVLYVAVEDRLGQASVLKVRGDLRSYQGDLAGAAEDYDAALALFVTEHDRLGRANVLEARGRLRSHQDDLAGAAEDYAAAHALYVALEERLGQANVLQLRGDLEIAKDEAADALRHYLAAELIYREVQDGLGLSYVLAEIARARATLGEREAAARAAREALQLAERSQNAYARSLATKVLEWASAE